MGTILTMRWLWTVNLQASMPSLSRELSQYRLHRGMCSTRRFQPLNTPDKFWLILVALKTQVGFRDGLAGLGECLWDPQVKEGYSAKRKVGLGALGEHG